MQRVSSSSSFSLSQISLDVLRMCKLFLLLIKGTNWQYKFPLVQLCSFIVNEQKLIAYIFRHTENLLCELANQNSRQPWIYYVHFSQLWRVLSVQVRSCHMRWCVEAGHWPRVCEVEAGRPEHHCSATQSEHWTNTDSDSWSQWYLCETGVQGLVSLLPPSLWQLHTPYPSFLHLPGGVSASAGQVPANMGCCSAAIGEHTPNYWLQWYFQVAVSTTALLHWRWARYLPL